MNKLKFLAFFLVLFMGACAQSPAARSGIATEPAFQTTSDARNTGSGGLTSGDKSAAMTAVPKDVSLDDADKNAQPGERKIIRNAELTLETASPSDALQKITAIAEGKGGFVVESQQSSSSAQATASDRVTMSLRIPAAKFNETIEEVRKVSSRVVVENIKGQDVTEEFIDIEARLKTKKALEDQYLEIMKQSKTVEDALKVQTDLATVRGEIEQLEGKKHFLENQTSLSTIKLTLQTPTAFSANSSGFIYQVGQSLSTGFGVALSFILGFITFIIAIIPFFVLVVLPLYLLFRYFWKKWKKQRLAAKLAREEKTE